MSTPSTKAELPVSDKAMKTQISRTPSLLLFPLLILLLSTKALPRPLIKQSCTSSCGDITDIAYPFRLNTDPPGCGDADYELSCENNKTLLEFDSGKYFVKQISYDTHIIRLVDVNLADGKCSLPNKSVSLDQVINDGRYRGSVGNTYTSFVQCRSELDLLGYRQVPCRSRNDSYVYVSYNNYIISDLQGDCSFVSRVPTIYQAVMNPSYQNILLLLQAGFDLAWSVECRDCVSNGDSCTVSSWDTPYSFECYSYRTGFYVPALLTIIFAAIWNLLLAINLFARFVLAPVVLIGFLIHKYRTAKKTGENRDNFPHNQQLLMPRRYTYSDIVTITDQFKDRLGQGGSGIVYKGQLVDGCLVAVKMLTEFKFSEEDFISEVNTIGRICHVNVIRLLGFCFEGSYRALIFEYMPNGSLDKYLLSKEKLEAFSWMKLLQIALGTAQGVKHLHEGCDVCILHFDVKPHNVLLDQNFVPKVSDFGLVKFYPKENDFISTSTIRGTMGYIAPELISRNLGAASCKSDVYSFGMLLLEMAEARRNIDMKRNCSPDIYFPSWVYDHLSKGGSLVLENVTEYESAIARKMCMVGLWCIQKRATDRPSMAKVVEMLEGNSDDLQLPPNSLSFPQTKKDDQSDSSTELLISETAEKSL